MASWSSTVKPFSDNLFKVDAIWKDGQNSYVKKFNNGIPTLIHDESFFTDSQFFLLMSGKVKKIPTSVILTLPEHGEIKLINASEQFAKLYVKHWESVGVKSLSIKENVGVKAPKPTEEIKLAVIEFFSSVAPTITSEMLTQSKSECTNLNRKLHEIHLRGRPKGKIRGRKPKVLTPQEAAFRDKIQNEMSQSLVAKKRLGRKVTKKTDDNSPHPTIDSNQFIKDSTELVTLEGSKSKCNIRRDQNSQYELIIDIPEGDSLNGLVLNSNLPFRTMKAAKKAKEVIESANNKELQMSPFVLYISKAKNGTTQDKQYFKVMKGVSELMDIFEGDWGGTQLGFSIHKSINEKLGKCSSKCNTLKNLAATSCKSSNAFSHF
ncbi:hypothetical protein VCHA53O466_40205 [Vibrio chagasii]|nr:hypothetical protein VCHA53O466_40205 [Vibrio chagasii]